MKKRLLSILLTACLALSLCTGLSGTLQVQAAGESSIHINDLVQVQVGESLTDLKVYRNGVYEAMVPVEAGDHTATVFINGAATDMTTRFTADADGEVCLRVKDNALTQVDIQSCALIGDFDGLYFVDEAGEPFYIGIWAPADPNAELTYLGGGLYGRTFRFNQLGEDFTIAGDGYKVAFNDGWDYSIGDGSGNIALTIPAGSSSFTILVDEINQVVYDSVRSGSFSVAQDSGAIALPALATTVSLIGTVRNGGDWEVDAKGYEFDLISDTLYRYEKTLEAGTYERTYNYKCVFDYKSWYAQDRSFTLTEKTHVVFLYDTVTDRLYDTVNDYSEVAKLIGMQAPPAQTKISAKYLDENGEEQTAFCDAAITADNRLTTWGEAGKTTWYVVQGAVTISQGVTVSGDVHLILADGCTLTLTDGFTAEDDLTIYAQSTGDAQGRMYAVGPGGSDTSCGIEIRREFTINGGSVTAEGGTVNAGDTATWALSYGIIVSNMTVNGGSVTATGGDEGSASYGILAGRELTITGGSVTATGGNGETVSYGIIAGNLTISGGSVEAKGSNAMISYGICTHGGDGGLGKMTISGNADVTAIGGNGETRSIGIFTEGDITIESATVNATGGTATATGDNGETRSIGIFSENNITIEGATVNATGGTATGDNGETVSCGIYARNNLRIDGGHVTAQTLAETATTKAALMLDEAPVLGENFDYYWRTDAAGSYTEGNFVWPLSDTYVEITDTPTYTVTLDPNGGTVEPSALTTGDGWKLTGNLPTPTRDGYTFDGWFTEAEDGDEVTTETVFDKDTTIYAHWTINQYTITFETDGGSEIDPITQDYGTDVTAPENPTKPGYTFAGWEPEIPDTMPAEDMTITAKWTKNSSGGGVSTYAINVESTKNGTVTMTPKTASKGTTVTLTVVPDKGYTLETLTVTDKNGNEIELTNKGDGKYTFKMPGSKVTVTATFMEDNSMLNFFVDVPADAYYYDAVLWAAENDITGGVDDTHFAPNAPCTRAQIVTFLWRAAGSPVVNYAMNFSDVPADAYYAEAVRWAVSQGITKGTGDGMFSPNAACTRAQAMAFIWRSQKSAAADGANPFNDVAADAYYADAVLWAVANGITNGTSDTTFSPNANCTRAQIVTFLFRCLGGE